MSFKAKVLQHITVPIEKAICRQIEGLECVAVYFHGQAGTAYMFNDPDADFAEDLESFLWQVRNGSALMVTQAEKFFGSEWPRCIRHCTPATAAAGN